MDTKNEVMNPGEMKSLVYPETNRFGKATAFLEEIANLTRFTFRYLTEVVKPPYEIKECLKQCYNIGFKSLPMVALTGLIMGLVMTIQARPTLAEFGATAWLPSMMAISIIREIGPVITALIFAGKVGSSIGAELASMKVTEQIDAMEVSGINPFRFIVVTRVFATTLMLPILVILSCGLSLCGAYIGVNLLGNVSALLFFSQVLDALSFSDILPALIKSIFFGFAIGILGCFKGYNASEGTEGVGSAANSAVVYGSIAVFVLDMIAAQTTSVLI
jgi:phospholipid/cholesterol/gamma-HCH transport system permease protein